MRKTSVLFPLALLLTACGGSSPTPGPDPIDTGGAAMTSISSVQGSGSRSPLEDTRVTVRGVVTGDFQDFDADDGNNLGGFFLSGLPDASLETSDGIFIYDGANPGSDVSVGDSVEVSGVVREFFGETQIHADTIRIVGRGQIRPATLFDAVGTTENSDGLPIVDLERFEGMLVRLANTMTVSNSFELDRFGELTLTEDGRAIIFTNQNAPSVSGFAAHRRELARRSIVLDDGRRDADPRPVRYFDASDPLRLGDQATGLTGVLRYSRGSGGAGMETWRLMPTEEPEFMRVNPRPAAPNPGGSLRIASINLLNFFTTLDLGVPACGPAGDASCRGADSQAEYDRQLQKSVSSLAAIDADIVGLVEIENNERASLQALTQGLADAGLDYDYVDTGTIGSDAIKVAFIYKPATVSPLGDFAVLDSSIDSRFIDSKNRPVLAQTFAQRSNGARLTVAVNHLKSKGSDCDELGDPDTGDGQGNCNITRTRAASAMADWLAADPTGSGDEDVLIIGDVNAHYREDPLVAMKDAGYTNLVETLQGTASYSFSFRGESGALDHALASESLLPQVSGAIEWHINSDEARLGDYNLEGNRSPDWFDGETPFRSADHDPLIIGLQLTAP